MHHLRAEARPPRPPLTPLPPLHETIPASTAGSQRRPVQTVEVIACVLRHPCPDPAPPPTLAARVASLPKKQRIECMPCGTCVANPNDEAAESYDGMWVQCDGCAAWMHGKCINFRGEPENLLCGECLRRLAQQVPPPPPSQELACARSCSFHSHCSRCRCRHTVCHTCMSAPGFATTLMARGTHPALWWPILPSCAQRHAHAAMDASVAPAPLPRCILPPHSAHTAPARSRRETTRMRGGRATLTTRAYIP